MPHKNAFFIISKSVMCVEQKVQFQCSKLWYYGDICRYLCEFPMILADFLLPDPDQGCQNDADSDPYHWSKVHIWRKIYDILVILVELWILFWLIYFANRVRFMKRIRIQMAKMRWIRNCKFLKIPIYSCRGFIDDLIQKTSPDTVKCGLVFWIGVINLPKVCEQWTQKYERKIMRQTKSMVS